ncbi:MAG: asparaginase [Burkholderiaceae bacterium]|jgi:glutamin-(asparagin-)ase|nr:asparaginase [Burkholderiaceae bacterium]
MHSGKQAPAALARIILLTTGGTIAGVAASSTASGYQAAVVDGRALLHAVPQVGQLASVRPVALLQMDSRDMTDAHRLQLARGASEWLARDDVDGLVITHGTDTLEESAYLLHLTLKTRKPVVLTGAMRAGNALSADGPANLYQAVGVAASAAAIGQGVLVVMDGAIWSARDVCKRDAVALAAFASPYGPLGWAVAGQPRFYRAACRAHTLQSRFSLDGLAALPATAVVTAHAGINAAHVRALAGQGVRGVVFAGAGAGSVPEALLPALRGLRAAGVQVVRAARAGQGPLVRGGNADDVAEGWICVDDQAPAQARVLLALALTVTEDTAALQAMFSQY